MKKQKVVILNITHGDNPYMDQSPFLPIAAGACRTDITNDACGEDNISAKNKWYGDFTSLYWAWKNLKDVDIIGTSHYRRYLADDDLLSPMGDQYLLSWENFAKRNYKSKRLVKLLDECDFVMLKEFVFETTVKEHYILCHPYPENMEYVTETLKKIHPESVDIWLQMLEEKSLQPGFLFVTKWQQYQELCEWLYPVLVELENQIDLSKYDGFQSRVIAFLYERLVPVFIRTKQYKVNQRALYLIDPSSKYSVEDYRRLYYKNKFLFYKRKLKRLIKQLLSIKQ